MARREQLELQKNMFIREYKRQRDEKLSRFNNHPVLNGRYLLCNMLGRGGFSEVYSVRHPLPAHSLPSCILYMYRSSLCSR